MTPVLRMTGIEKRFGPVIALENVDFEVERGEIHALLGVNGAGKSTLIKILCGLHSADSGQIEIDGQTVDIRSPRDAHEHGIASVQQHPELVGDLSGFENVYLGQEARGRSLFNRLDRKKIKTMADDLLARLPVDVDLSQPVETLPRVEREIIAILHSLKQDNKKVLILDEPTSTLTAVEKAQLFQMMAVLKETGTAIVYITHRLEEVFEICDRFTVFQGGRRVATLRTTEMSRADGPAAISRMMLSKSLGDLYPAKAGPSDAPPRLSVSGYTLKGAFDPLSLDLRPGEITGLYGLVGSGIEELAKTLFGALRPDGGTMTLDGKPLALRQPKDALRAGMFLVPGDRRAEGLVLGFDATFNTTLAALDRASSLAGITRFAANRAVARDLAEQVDLQPPVLTRPASAFSGGNQQKMVVAKGLFRQARVYFFLEPSVGVDVGARSRLYGLIRDLSRSEAVLILSSDCDEVCGLADRAGAMFRGALVLPPAAENSRETVLSAGLVGKDAA